MLLAFSSALLFHLLLLSLCGRHRLLLALGLALLFHLLLLSLPCSFLSGPGSRLPLTVGLALLLKLLSRLLLLSPDLRGGLRLLLNCALLVAHKLTHFAPSRLVTLLSATCELIHPLRLS